RCGRGGSRPSTSGGDPIGRSRGAPSRTAITFGARSSRSPATRTSIRPPSTGSRTRWWRRWRRSGDPHRGISRGAGLRRAPQALGGAPRRGGSLALPLPDLAGDVAPILRRGATPANSRRVAGKAARRPLAASGGTDAAFPAAGIPRRAHGRSGPPRRARRARGTWGGGGSAGRAPLPYARLRRIGPLRAPRGVASPPRAASADDERRGVCDASRAPPRLPSGRSLGLVGKGAGALPARGEFPPAAPADRGEGR